MTDQTLERRINWLIENGYVDGSRKKEILKRMSEAKKKGMNLNFDQKHNDDHGLLDVRKK